MRGLVLRARSLLACACVAMAFCLNAENGPGKENALGLRRIGDEALSEGKSAEWRRDALARELDSQPRAEAVAGFVKAGGDVNKLWSQFWPRHGRTPDSAYVKELLAYGAAVDMQMQFGTALVQLSGNRDEKGQANRLAVMTMLLEKGADPNAPPRLGAKAVLISVLGWQSVPRDMVKLLLEKGANPECSDAMGRTAIEVAFGNGLDAEKLEIVRLLLAHGTDVSGKHLLDGMRKWSLASGKLELVKELVEKGAAIDNLAIGAAWPDPAVRRYLLEKIGADESEFEVVDWEGGFSVHRSKSGGTCPLNDKACGERFGEEDRMMEMRAKRHRELQERIREFRDHKRRMDADRRREREERLVCDIEQTRENLERQRRFDRADTSPESASSEVQRLGASHEGQSALSRTGLTLGVGLVVVLVIVGMALSTMQQRKDWKKQQKTADAQRPEAKPRQGRCITCGEESHSTHRIYQSLSRKADDTDNETRKWIFRRGFSVPMCRKCLWKYRLRIVYLHVVTMALCIGGLAICCVYWAWACDAGASWGKSILALVLVFIAIGISAIFYQVARAALDNTFLCKVDDSHCRELSQLRSEGYVPDSPGWPRVVRDAKDAVDCQEERRRSTKYRSWTEHSDYKWMGAFNPEGFPLNRECAAHNVDEKTAPEKQSDVSWQNDKLALENPPNGVSVSAWKGACGYSIVYRRRRIGRIIMGLMWIMASVLGVCSLSSSISNLSGIYLFLSGIACILGCSYLKRELFGKNTLKLTSFGGDYTASGSIFWGRWEKFPLSPKTLIHYKTRKGLFDFEYRDIAIKNEYLEEIRFGSSIPNEVQDYLCACMSRWASGRPLSVTQGATWHANLEHPFLFSAMAIMTVISFVYAFSCQERVTVRSGKVQIAQSELWGCGEKVTEIPSRDIARLDVEEWHGSRGSAGRRLRIVGHDGKAIATIGGLDKDAREYHEGMERALDGSCGQMFERKRNNGDWYWLLALALGTIAALLCGDGNNRKNRR